MEKYLATDKASRWDADAARIEQAAADIAEEFEHEAWCFCIL